MSVSAEASGIKLAVDLTDFVLRLRRSYLARENPELTDQELDELALAFLESRPPDGVGRPRAAMTFTT